MIVVIDTNVFISGIFWSGPPYAILQAWQAGTIELAVSHEILDEYQRVANTLQKKYPSVDLDPFIELLTLKSKLFQPVLLNERISTDPDDDKFIACALAADAGTIVSGDSDLTDIKTYRDIEILKPKQFRDKFLK